MTGMNRPFRVLASTLPVVAVLAVSAPAHAAAPKCTSGGAKVLAATRSVSVVSVTPKQKGSTVPKDKVYGCWVSSGKRFQLFTTYLSDETDRFEIVGDRYIGVFREIEGGVAGSTSAVTWDARKRVAAHDSGPCDTTQQDPDDDESRYGPDSAVFFAGGGIAYTCAGGTASHIVDAKDDRLLEPAGTGVSGLAVTPDGHQLYYSANGTLKSLSVK
jgi:hypothetical protein